MGEVYLAEHKYIARRAAIKFLLPELAGSGEVASRFFSEARAASLIHHPGIVEVLDCDIHKDGRAFIVMELLEGESLRSYIERNGKCDGDPAGALAMCWQMAHALAAAHGKKIIHRDLKPENVFLHVRAGVSPFEPIVKLLDFGIAKLQIAGGGATKTRTGQLLGTPLYMSPEQCRGSRQLDGRKVAGVCDPATGACPTPTNAPSTTTCDDGNLCTKTDMCQSGVCVGSNPVDCSSPPACHTAGSCSMSTGTCSYPTAADNASCGSGFACVSGACTQSRFTRLGTDVSPGCLSDNGTILVGYSNDRPAFLWTSAGFKSLPNLAPYTDCNVQSISGDGRYEVGFCNDATTPVRWTGTNTPVNMGLPSTTAAGRISTASTPTAL